MLSLNEILKSVHQLEVNDLLLVQEKITQELRQKVQLLNGAGVQSATTANLPEPPVTQQIQIPGAYQPTKAQVEASLARMFTPEQIALIGKTGVENVQIQGKSASQMLIEDREDRF